MLPLLYSVKDAITAFHKTQSDAVKCWIIHFLSTEMEMSNKDIRIKLGIEKTYEVTHYRRCGKITEEELELWDNNTDRISLSHVRAIANLKKETRQDILRSLLVKNISSRKLESIAKEINNNQSASHDLIDNQSFDIKKYAEDVGDKLGRIVSIKHNQNKNFGTLSLEYYGIDDLSDLVKNLGFEYDEDNF